jgi:hypothetical protein
VQAQAASANGTISLSLYLLLSTFICYIFLLPLFWRM